MRKSRKYTVVFYSRISVIVVINVPNSGLCHQGITLNIYSYVYCIIAGNFKEPNSPSGVHNVHFANKKHCLKQYTNAKLSF